MENGKQQIRLLARSKCGHDKGRLYVLIGEDGDRYLLADGKGRTLEKPKRKNKKHVQPIRHIPQEVRTCLLEAEHNSDIIHAVRVYEKSMNAAGGKTEEKSLEDSRCQNLM